MNKIDIYISPYYKPNAPRTRLYIDGVRINNPNNRLTQFVVQRSMNKWLHGFKRKLFVWKGFFYELALELNSAEYTINFYGLPEDYERFSEEVTDQQLQLEKDGRNVKIHMSFTKHYDLVKAIENLKLAYENIFFKAKREDNVSLSERIISIKDKLSVVPCRIIVKDEKVQSQIDRSLDNDGFFRHTVNRPNITVVVADGIADADAVVSEIKEAVQKPCCSCIYVLLPESADKQYEEKLIGMIDNDEVLLEKLFIRRYSEDPISRLKDCLYYDYMPDIINIAIAEYYDIIRCFSDSDDDAYIIEANSIIDELFV